MQLSDIGKIIANKCIKTTKIRNNIELGRLVRIPNHFHGIAVLDKIVETHCNESLRYLGNCC